MKDQSRVSGRTRRLHDRAFKNDLIARSLVLGASVAGIALEGGINANLLFKWRREHVRAMAVSTPKAATLLPVCVVPETASPPTVQPTARVPAINRGSSSGVIEIEVAGAQLRLRGTVDETTLSTVLRALRQSA